MKKLLIIGLALITSFMAYGALAAQDTATIAVKNDPKLGMILTDPDGKVLYLYLKDEKDESYCYDKCAENWPPALASDGAKPMGAWTIVTRDDGLKQWALNGKPVYAFVKDTKPGDKVGDGFLNGAWHVAKQ